MAIYKRSGNWYVDFYADGKRRREKIGPNKKLAETVLAKRKVEIAEGRFLDIRKQLKVGFEDFGVEYLEFSKNNKRSWTRDRVSIKNLKATFGGKFLSEITPLMIEHYKARRKDEVAPATVNREVACLKHMFTKAIEWGNATESPAKKVRLLRENNARLRYLTLEEAKRLIAAATPHLRPILIVALCTGMRKGEILRLKWQDIHWKRGVILLTDTKNGQWREVPMNGVLTETLREMMKRSVSPYVFTSWTGKPFTEVRKSFDSALEMAKIEDFRFHDLRHTFASHLVMAGVDLTTIKELLGHKTIEMTMRYSHLSPLHKKQAVERLEEEMDTIWTPASDSAEKLLV